MRQRFNINSFFRRVYTEFHVTCFIKFPSGVCQKMFHVISRGKTVEFVPESRFLLINLKNIF